MTTTTKIVNGEAIVEVLPKLVLTGLSVTDTPMTDEERENNKRYAASCGKCGGWTCCGGMSQFYYTKDGCKCNGVTG